jgi:hypothetical protein
MSGERKENEARAAANLLSTEIKELQKQYMWKAENIVRFIEKLGMTQEQKVEFVAYELANAYVAHRFNFEAVKRG